MKKLFLKDNFISRLFIYALMLVAGTVAGTLCLLMVYLIPSAPMKENLKYSMIAISQDSDSTGELLFGDRSSFAGAFTNELMLLEAVSDNDHPLFQKAMGAYRPVYGDDLWYPDRALVAILGGDEEYPLEEEDYARYWHGYLVLLKPMLLVMSYEEIKLFNTMALTVLFILTLLFLIKKQYGYGAVGFTAMWFLMMPPAVALGLQLTPCAYIMFVTMLLLFKTKPEAFSYIMFGCGMAVAFFDFLTFPLVTLTVPLALIMSDAEKCPDLKKCFMAGLRSTAAWASGYIVFWGMKWVMGSIALKKNLFADAFETVTKRTSSGDVSRISMFLQAVYKNLYCFKALPYIVLILALMVFWVVRAVKSKCITSGACLVIISGILPSLFWIFFAVNHSYEHATYTYRILAPPVFAAFLVLDKNEEKITGKIKDKAKVSVK